MDMCVRINVMGRQAQSVQLPTMTCFGGMYTQFTFGAPSVGLKIMHSGHKLNN